MEKMFLSKIDVRKIDKARLFEGKPDKDGHKPLWLDLVHVAKKEVGQFGDTHFVVQSKKKDENVQMPILGNTKPVGSQRPPQQSAPAQSGPDEEPAF